MLEREGVAIVTGVIDAAELAQLERDFFDDLRSVVDTEVVQSCDDPRVRDAPRSPDSATRSFARDTTGPPGPRLPRVTAVIGVLGSVI